jgi:hypothetical protein
MNQSENNINEVLLRERMQAMKFSFSEEAWNTFENIHPEIEEKTEIQTSINYQKTIKIIIGITLAVLAIYSINSIFDSENKANNSENQSDSKIQNNPNSLPIDSIKKTELKSTKTELKTKENPSTKKNQTLNQKKEKNTIESQDSTKIKNKRKIRNKRKHRKRTAKTKTQP